MVYNFLNNKFRIVFRELLHRKITQDGTSEVGVTIIVAIIPLLLIVTLIKLSIIPNISNIYVQI